jgi:hypothetical protein
MNLPVDLQRGERRHARRHAPERLVDLALAGSKS